MSISKLSLVTALLIASSAFAVENTKVSGNAKLYYGTQNSDVGGSGDFFSKDSSYADFAAHLDLTTDLTKWISAGVGAQVVTTLGAEHNVISNVWSGAHGLRDANGKTLAGGNRVNSSLWIDEAWLSGNAFDTTLKIGRQALDTPLAFTETWGIDKNTFEAAVLTNRSIVDTAIIGAFIGRSNGSSDERASTLGNGFANPRYIGTSGIGGSYVSGNGRFSTFGTDGAYALGVINKSYKPLKLQAWYYDIVNLAKAYWLQADLNSNGVLAGIQLVNTKADASSKDTTGYSAMLGYEIKDIATIKGACSSVGDGGALGVANSATGTSWTIGGQSQLYTEMWWNYGNVSVQGSNSYSLTAEGEIGAKVKLLGGIYHSNINNNIAATDRKVTEASFVASKSFGSLDTALALIFADKDFADNTKDVKSTDVQLYLTYNF